LADYENALQEMGFQVKEKILVYMNENMEVVKV